MDALFELVRENVVNTFPLETGSLWNSLPVESPDRVGSGADKQARVRQFGFLLSLQFEKLE